MRSIVVTVGLHLSLMAADLPCLQAWVVSLDLEIHTTVMYLIFKFFDYMSSLKQGVHCLDLNEFWMLPEIKDDICQTGCWRKEPIRGRNSTEVCVSGYAFKIKRHVIYDSSNHHSCTVVTSAAACTYRGVSHQWRKAGRTQHSDSWCRKEWPWTDRRNLWPHCHFLWHCPHRWPALRPARQTWPINAHSKSSSSSRQQHDNHSLSPLSHTDQC